MSEPTPRAGRVWRALVPVAGVAAGLLLTTTAVTARGTDLRSSRTLQVSQLIQRQQATVTELTREEARLRSRISATTALAAVGDERSPKGTGSAVRLRHGPPREVRRHDDNPLR